MSSVVAKKISYYFNHTTDILQKVSLHTRNWIKCGLVPEINEFNRLCPV